jgi:hypothetical protein
MEVAERTHVKLPPDVGPAIEVFINGVPQQPGVDFHRQGSELVFTRTLAREGRLGFWRWFSIAFGIAGTYRQNDLVDVVYDRDGRRTVASGLPPVSD